jgi:hypothetical protein
MRATNGTYAEQTQRKSMKLRARWWRRSSYLLFISKCLHEMVELFQGLQQ